VQLSSEEYEELSIDLSDASSNNLTGEPLCILANSYKIYNAASAQEYDPTCPS
jgi:hypothetical protein